MYSAGFLTYPQHHASGMASWVSVVSGMQMWTIFRPRWNDPERAKAAMRILATAVPDQSPDVYEDMFDVGTLMLTPGNVLYVCQLFLMYSGLTSYRILPPGTFHMVYNPMNSVVLGGNFLTIETLHLTLMTRQVEQWATFTGTSPYSAGVLRLLARIAIMFTSMSGQQSMSSTLS